MRQKVARSLRKWADLIDPRTPPRDPFVITIEVDSSQAKAKIDELIKDLEKIKLGSVAGLFQ